MDPDGVVGQGGNVMMLQGCAEVKLRGTPVSDLAFIV